MTFPGSGQALALGGGGRVEVAAKDDVGFGDPPSAGLQAAHLRYDPALDMIAGPLFPCGALDALGRLRAGAGGKAAFGILVNPNLWAAVRSENGVAKAKGKGGATKPPGSAIGPAFKTQLPRKRELRNTSPMIAPVLQRKPATSGRELARVSCARYGRFMLNRNHEEAQ